MTRSIGLVALAMLAALAMPLSADARGGGGGGHGGGGGGHGGGGGGHGGGHFSGGGGGAHFSGGGGGVRSFSSGGMRSFSSGGRSFNAGRSFSSGRSFNTGRSVHRGTSFNRSAQSRQLRGSSSRQLTTSSIQGRNAGLRSRSTAGTQRALRSSTSGLTAQAGRQARFAGRFAASGHTHNHFAAHQAWRHGWHAGFVPWYGPIFWPYAYADLFYFAFWPYGYDDGYWAYAYDNFFDGVYWGSVGPPADYAYGAAVAAPRASRASYAGVQELCTQPGSGVTAWPFADIERKVGLTDGQKQLLGDVRKAAGDAAAGFKASCPAENAFPLTPPGRLAAMTARLDATLQAAQTVRPPLEKFYDALSDEQKERFNRIGPKKPAASAQTSQASADPQSCKEQKPGLTNLPIERIKDAIKPTEAQQGSLKGLESATVKAVSILQAACPDETPLTPTGRLEAMETRLKAMIEAAQTVKPWLEDFYGSLSPEQKARFNRVGGALAQAD